MNLVVYELKGGIYYRDGVKLDMAGHLALRGELQRKHLAERWAHNEREEFWMIFDLDRDADSSNFADPLDSFS